jgi:hypothetical protein
MGENTAGGGRRVITLPPCSNQVPGRRRYHDDSAPIPRTGRGFASSSITSPGGEIGLPAAGTELDGLSSSIWGALTGFHQGAVAASIRQGARHPLGIPMQRPPIPSESPTYGRASDGTDASRSVGSVTHGDSQTSWLPYPMSPNVMPHGFECDCLRGLATNVPDT